MQPRADAITTFAGQLSMGAMKLPLKTIVVSTAKGVVLISPSPELAEHKAAIDALGDVTAIVAPNLFHHLGAAAALELYPNATLWACPGLDKKQPKVAWQKTLTIDDWPYADELELLPVLGMPKVNEVVFRHQASRTLIVTDLCFNHIHGKGVGNWIVFHIFGTYKRFAVSRLYAKFVKDKNAFNDSVGALLASDFEEIVLPHGENVTDDAKGKLRTALAERGIDL